MKRILLFLTILFILVSLCGCDNETVPSADNGQVGDFSPLFENTRYIYEGQGNEYASYDVYTDYTASNKVQQRVDNGGTVLAKILAIKEGKLVESYAKEEVYYRQNYLEEAGNKEEILLMEPLVTGTTWTLADSRVRTITNTGVALSTPAGDFTTIEVTTESGDSHTIQYYAEGVGLVKNVFISGKTEITSTLSSIEQDTPLTQTVRFYYPNIEDSRIYYEDKNIDFWTNDTAADVLTAAYKENVPAGMGTVFSANTIINSLSLNDDGMVYIDLNAAFVEEMNAGAEFEAMILQSIANTFGNYYNAEKVVLTVGGKPYLSGHFMFEPGDYLNVDLTDTVSVG